MMYVHVWNKYLPIIKILMKKSTVTGTQTFDMNRIDFEKAGSGRKAGYKFSIEFRRGKVANVISSSQLATDLASVLTSDPAMKLILSTMDVTVTLNPKFQLILVNKEAVNRQEELQLQPESH